MKKVSFREAFLVWLKVALYSFGGPAGQIAVMHKLIVEERKWISESRFLHALNYCMLLPGPEAQQLITYIGWLQHKTKGGLIAGSLFILPGFIAILLLSILYVLYSDVSFVTAMFFGIKPAVVAIVFGAVVKLGQRALKNYFSLTIAILSFVSIFFLKISFPLIIIFAGLAGFLASKITGDKFKIFQNKEVPIEEDAFELFSPKVSFLSTVKTVVLFLVIWSLPLIILIFMFHPKHILVQEMIFFSKAAVVTFGGAYSVLAYVAQQAVENYQWLMPGEMLDGLGMAETTPGPLIQVVQFVGFMGAYRFPEGIEPLVAAIISSVLVTWVTFVPCFLFIFTGAPYIDKLRNHSGLNAALSGVTAAVIGVIVNLALWFSIHILFKKITEINTGIFTILKPDTTTFDLPSAIVMVIAFISYFLLKLSMLLTIMISVISGVIIYYLFKQPF
ncbi:MAG: chromate efflux transporter [Bacteroidia bacterium]